MIDREKREKVINKVKAIVADMQEEVDEWKDYSDSELRGGLTCDCDWWYKTLQTLKDALALLKAQEPRVLTLDEALNCLVIEYSSGKLQEVGKRVFTEGLGYYGNLWRVWDRMPTDEQREKEPWDDAER